MNDNVKKVALIAASFICGFSCGVLTVRAYFQKKENDDVEAVKEAFARYLSPDDKCVSEIKENDDSLKKLTSTIDAHVAKKESDYVRYNFSATNSDEDQMEFADYIAAQEGSNMSAQRINNMHRPPFELDGPGNVGEIVTYGIKNLNYFQGDSTLTDELEEILPDKRQFLGDAIETIDRHCEGEIYLQNDRTSEYYVVHIYPGKYSEQ